MLSVVVVVINERSVFVEGLVRGSMYSILSNEERVSIGSRPLDLKHFHRLCVQHITSSVIEINNIEVIRLVMTDDRTLNSIILIKTRERERNRVREQSP